MERGEGRGRKGERERGRTQTSCFKFLLPLLPWWNGLYLPWTTSQSKPFYLTLLLSGYFITGAGRSPLEESRLCSGADYKLNRELKESECHYLLLMLGRISGAASAFDLVMLPDITHCLTKMDLRRISSLVCPWCLIWSKQTFVLISLAKAMQCLFSCCLLVHPMFMSRHEHQHALHSLHNTGHVHQCCSIGECLPHYPYSQMK